MTTEEEEEEKESFAREELQESLRVVKATRFNPEKPPVVGPCILSLAGIEIGHSGNIVTVVAPPKAGKSSAIGAAIASFLGPAGRDYLGFAGLNPSNKAIVHFDNEQSRVDHHTMMMAMLRRAGLTQAPKWFHSYSLVGHSPTMRRRLIKNLIGHAASLHSGVQCVCIDGAADAVLDVNDAIESNNWVFDLVLKGKDLGCLIVTSLHQNPGSDKARGHLGSELERKSESMLVLRKQSECTTISCKPARHAEVTGDTAPRFTWSKDAGMHVSLMSKAMSSGNQKLAGLIELAEEAFGDKTKLKWADLKRAIMAARDYVKSTAEGKIGEMKRSGVIHADGFGFFVKASKEPRTPEEPRFHPDSGSVAPTTPNPDAPVCMGEGTGVMGGVGVAGAKEAQHDVL